MRIKPDPGTSKTRRGGNGMMRGFILATLCAGAAWGQAQHVEWTLTAEGAPGKLLVRAAAKIEPGWHLYSASSPAGIPTSFQVTPSKSVRVFAPAPKKAFDPNFGSDTETYEGEATFVLEAAVDGTPASVDVKVRYQTCNDTQCVPSRWSGSVPVTPAA